MRKRSRNVHDSERHTVKVQVRCDPALAAKLRELIEARGLTYAEIFEAGLAMLAKPGEKSEP